MKFKSKYDSSTHIILILLTLVGSPILIAPLSSMIRNASFSIGLSLLALVGVGCVIVPLWMGYTMSYRFTPEHLLVKLAFVRIKIPYEQIKTVTKANQMWEGLRISASKDAIHIKYVTGDIKISPTPMNLFLEQLKSHCPSAKIDVPKEWQSN